LLGELLPGLVVANKYYSGCNLPDSPKMLRAVLGRDATYLGPLHEPANAGTAGSPAIGATVQANNQRL